MLQYNFSCSFGLLPFLFFIYANIVSIHLYISAFCRKQDPAPPQ